MIFATAYIVAKLFATLFETILAKNVGNQEFLIKQIRQYRHLGPGFNTIAANSVAMIFATAKNPYHPSFNTGCKYCLFSNMVIYSNYNIQWINVSKSNNTVGFRPGFNTIAANNSATIYATTNYP